MFSSIVPSVCTVLIAHLCMQLRFAAMRCYAPDPAGEANSAPSDLLAGFWGEERKGKGSEKEKGRRGMCERGKEKEAKAKSRGGKEKETKRRGGRKGKENEKKKRGGKGRNFVQL